jgi:hypothetical protein
MGASDQFPVDCDYGYEVGREGNVLRGRVESAREYFRQRAAPRRVFALVFSGRPRSDWTSIENFWHKMAVDFFTIHAKESGGIGGRKYSVVFNGPPAAQVSGFEEFDIRCEVIEAVGAAMYVYPDFSGYYPYINIPVASALDLGGSGKLFTYAGYGYRVNGTFTTIYLDEVATAGEVPNLPVPLGLHRVRVVGGAPTSIDYLI